MKYKQLISGQRYQISDPYASWQKGAIENVNGLIRQYLHKGSSFKDVDDRRIKQIQDKINMRPRKKLGFISPYEAFSKLCT